jgi:hypothetical protein
MEFTIDIEKLQQKGLFVGMPLYGGLMTGSTAKSLMGLTGICAKYGIKMNSYFMMNESLIQRARNYITDEFLRSDYDTFMFIDGDVGFEAIDVLSMFHLQNEHKYDIIAAPYPKKTISWEKIARAVDKGHAEEDPNNLENYVGDYVFSPAVNGEINIAEPAEVLEAGTGFMMITRDALERWKTAYPRYEYTPDHARTKNFDGSRKIHAFFHCEIDPDTNQYLSEDYFFCRMARKAGIKIWLAPWIQLSHTGSYEFKGSLPHIAAIGESINVDVSRIKKK